MKSFLLGCILVITQLAYADVTYEINPIADTYVTSESENRNFGSESILDLKTYHAGTRLLVRFDRNEISALLANKDLISARLELPINLHWVKQPGEIGLFKMKVDWTEQGATWKCPNDSNVSNYNQDCATPWLMWSHDPNNTIPYPYETTPFAIGNIIGEQQVPLGFNVENYIKDLAEGGEQPDYGFAVFKVSTNINDPLSFYSRESDVGPRIIITAKDKVTAPQGLLAKLSVNSSSGQAPLSVHFDASSSKAPAGKTIQSYELNLGNGYIALNANNPVFSHIFPQEGEYQAILRVTDSGGDIAHGISNISVLGDENNNLDKNYGYWINFPQSSKINYRQGERAQLTGDVCKIWKTQGKNGDCQWVDKQKLNIQAFFPDMTKNVSSLLNVQTTNNKRILYFETPALNKENLNVLTIVVGEIDPNSMQLAALKSKLDMRILVLDQKVLEFENQGLDEKLIDVLRDVRKTLTSLKTKIDSRNAKIPSLLAQYNLPLNVDNKVSAGRYYSTMVGGFRYELSSEIGNLFQGEFASIKSRITNINFESDISNEHEGYDFKYMFKGNLVSTKNRSTFSKGETQEYTYLTNQRATLTDFLNFGVEIEEKFKWWSRKLGETEFSMSVVADTSAPNWINPQSEMVVSQYMPKFSERAVDDSGRLDRNSFKAILSGTENVDISDKFSFETSTKSTEYSIKADIGGIYPKEGYYELSLSIADFNQQKSNPEPYIKKFFIDRSPPFILMPPVAHSNEESFELPFTVTDVSPFSFKIFVNGILIQEISSPAGVLTDSVAVDLVEGINLVRIEAIDSLGYSVVVNYPPIFLDTTPPELASINIQNGQLVQEQIFTLRGKANEILKAVYVNGDEVDISDEPTSEFIHEINLIADGEQRIEVRLLDLAENEISYSFNYHFLLRLLNANLINVVPSENPEKLKIIGYPGAASPGIEISAEEGFFNNAEMISNQDGSFEFELDAFNFAKVTAYDPTRDRSESAVVSFKADTTLAGLIKDTDENPLPGVVVTIASSGQTSITDASGSFAIPNPALGDQLITIDGRGIPSEFTQGQKSFSVISMNVSLGNEQKNILERTIYLAPKMLDGTETEVILNSATTVSSTYAPGVELVIPANASTFPGGSKIGTINVIQIPTSKTSIDILEEAEPDSVYALEPSGLTFSSPVKLTLPNVNEFPDGTELVIMSKNSLTGNWELDGAAKVENDKVVTKPGQGITHFSEVFASPMGMKIEAYRSENKISFNTLDGAVTTSVSLPTFKSLNRDYATSLIYKSNWADPTVVISNIFDLPSEYMVRTGSISQGGVWGKAKATETLQQWITPEYIDAQFTSGDLVSEKIRFTGMPKKSLVSYQMNLGELPSGIHPAKSSYEVRFKELVIRTLKIKSKSALGKTKTKTKSYRDEKLLEEIFPQELVTTLYHQNKKDSEAGSGWRINLGKRILNPRQDRLILEDEQGETHPYSLKNTIETVQYDEKGYRSFTTNGDKVVAINTEGEVLSSSTVTDTQHLFNLVPYQGKMGTNTSWYTHWTRRCTKSGFNGCRKHEYTYFYQCKKSQRDFSFQRKVKSMISRNGQLVYLDQLGAIWGSNSLNPIAGYFDLPNSLKIASNVVSEQDHQSHCNSYGKENCGNITKSNQYGIRVVNGPTNTLGWCNNVSLCASGNCTPQWEEGEGKVPHQGFQDGAHGYAKFNQPIAISDGPIPDSYLVADYGNNLVRLVDTISGYVTTYAGNMKTLDEGDGGNAIAASIYHPRGVLLLEDSSVLVSSENGFIRRVTTDGKIAHFAGKPTSKGGILTDITDMSNVALSSPSSLAYDRENNYVYVADTGHNRVLRLDITNEEARVVAGNGTCATEQTFDDKAALDASLCRPEQIAVDSNGNLLVLDEANKRIRRINFSTPENGLIKYEPLAKDNSHINRDESGEFTLITRNGTQTTFSKDGYESRNVDKAGRTTSFTYNDQNQLLSVMLPTNQSIRLSYSGNYLSEITDPSGKKTKLRMSGKHLAAVEFADGTEKNFHYNQSGILKEEINQRGTMTKFNLNEWNRLSEVVRADGSSMGIEDSASKTISNDNTNGNSTELISLEDQKEYLMDIVRDPKGNETKFSRDINGYIEEVIDSLGGITKIERDSNGKTKKITNPDLTFTELTYNQVTGDMIKKFESASNTTEEFEYNQFGKLTSYKDQLNREKKFIYDPLNGLLIKTVHPNGHFEELTYNNHGLVVTFSNSMGHTTSYTYNSEGNTNSTTMPMGERIVLTRDNSGNIISKTDAKGLVHTFTFDIFNRLLSVKTPGDHLTSFNYLPTGELSTVINPQGFQTKLEYDELGRMNKKTSPRGQETRYFYDNSDNLVREITPKGDEKIFEYDDKNKLIRKSLPDDIYEFAYNANGNITSASNSSSVLQFSYRSIANKEYISSVNVSGPDYPSQTINYSHDLLGNVTHMQSSYINLDYSYDLANRISSVRNSKGQNFSFVHDGANRLIQISRPGGLTTDLSYDANSFVTEINHHKNSNFIDSLVYTRDLNGNKISATSGLGVQQFTYDVENQLTSVSNPEADLSHQMESFTYDSLGNRTSDANGIFIYDDKKVRLEEDWKFQYIYDLNGNLTSKQEKGPSGKVWTYGYTSENQLIHAEHFVGVDKIWTASFVYDAQGRRIKKNMHNFQNGNILNRIFVYDKEDIIAEIDEDNSVLAKYTHSGLKMDDVLSVEITNAGVSKGLAAMSGDFFYLKDSTGAVRAIASHQDEVVEKYIYSGFGKLLKSTDLLGNQISSFIKTNFAFANREYDEELGLYYNRARYYDAHSGRFIQEDPFSGLKTLPSSVNSRYNYALNNPGRFSDPTGMFPPDVHGNFCGNGRNKANAIDLEANPEPVDRLDDACRRHDIAYRDPHFWVSFNSDRARKQLDTDLELVYYGQLHSWSSLSKGDIGGFLKGQIISLFGWSSASLSYMRFAAGSIFKLIGITL